MSNFFRIFTKSIGLIIVITAAFLLLCAFLTSYIESDKPWVLTAGLIMPILYIINIVIFLYLIIKSKYILSIIPLAALLLTFTTATSMYGINLFKRYDDSKYKIKILTYNTHGYRDTDFKLKFDEMMNELDSISADILFLQEFSATKVLSLDSIQSRLPKYKYIHLHISDSTSTTQTTGSGIAILSRYPLINQVNIDFEDTSNRFMVSNAIIGSDTLTLINVHLQSTGVNITDANNLRNIQDSLSLLKDTAVYKNTLIPLYEKLLVSNSKRRTQTDKVAKFITSSKHPVILCGDFNSVPSSYTYRCFTSRHGLKDPFLRFGVGYEATYKLFKELLRIDYILHSEDYTSVSFNVPHLKYSDHYPVYTELTKKK
ncbi:MAG: endonuclease/exonuclease/phosphatase family protein [Rikenellaceae bacterium]